MIVRFYTEIMLTHKTCGASAGWQRFCGGHDKMDDAIICNEKSRALLKEQAPQHYPDQNIKIRIKKRTDEIVEEATEVEI